MRTQKPSFLCTNDQNLSLHLAEVGRASDRSKEATLLRIKDSLGTTRVSHISRDGLVQFAKRRAKEGAGPVTIGIDISFTGTVLEHATAVHGILVATEQVRLARIALNRLGLVARSNERDRRPTLEWLAQIIATAMRHDEICRVSFDDFNATQSTLVRSMKPMPIR